MIVRLYDAKRIVGSTDLAFNVEGHIDIVTDEQYTESVIISQENHRIDVEWTNSADDHKENRPVWNDEVEQRIREKLMEDYMQANNMICFASRADHPIDEGLIREAESADSIIKFIKKELGFEPKK